MLWQSPPGGSSLASTVLMFISIYAASTCFWKRVSSRWTVQINDDVITAKNWLNLGVDVMVTVAATPGFFWHVEEKLDEHWK